MASFEDTLKIARFMVCDRDAAAFSRSPTEGAFQAYVREHFWPYFLMLSTLVVPRQMIGGLIILHEFVNEFADVVAYRW